MSAPGAGAAPGQLCLERADPAGSTPALGARRAPPSQSRGRMTPAAWILLPDCDSERASSASHPEVAQARGAQPGFTPSSLKLQFPFISWKSQEGSCLLHLSHQRDSPEAFRSLKASLLLHRCRNRGPGTNSDLAVVTGPAGSLLCSELDMTSRGHFSDLSVRCGLLQSP